MEENCEKEILLKINNHFAIINNFIDNKWQNDKRKNSDREAKKRVCVGEFPFSENIVALMRLIFNYNDENMGFMLIRYASDGFPLECDNN